MLFITQYINSQINTIANLNIFVFIISVSLRSSKLLFIISISNKYLIISKNLSLTTVIVFTLLDHFVEFNLIRLTSYLHVHF